MRARRRRPARCAAGGGAPVATVGWLLAAALALAGCGGDPRPDVLLVSLDTVRADHLSVYGYPRSTTPRLEALAREGVVFEQAIAASTQTVPSHGSFLTGLDPHRHGAEVNGVRIRAGATTLAEILAGEGYDTAAFVSGYPMKADVSGLDRGFARYDDRFEGKRRQGRETARRLADWLAGRETDRPYFAFLHLYDAHGPYLPPADYAFRFRSEGPTRRVERLPPYQIVHDREGLPLLDLDGYLDRYDTMIRYQDDLLAWLLGKLDLARTVVVVVADHGETLDERHWMLDHGGQVFEEQVRIPWIVAAPGLAPRRVAGLVRGVDLMPTVVELAGVTLPEELTGTLAGRGLGPLLAGGEAGAAHYAFSTALPFAARHADRGYELTRERPILALRTARWKLLSYPCAGGAPCLELYDLERDPREGHNVEAAEPERRDRMLRALEAWYGTGAELADPESLDPEVRETLRSLGYLGG